MRHGCTTLQRALYLVLFAGTIACGLISCGGSEEEAGETAGASPAASHESSPSVEDEPTESVSPDEDEDAEPAEPYVKRPLVLPEIIAEVDGEKIRKIELETLIARRHEKKAFARYTIFYSEVLEHCMKKRNLTTPEEEVDAYLAESLERGKTDLPTLLAKKNFDEAYLRRQIRAVLNMRKYAVSMGLVSPENVEELKPMNPRLLDDICLEHDIKLMPDGLSEEHYATVNGEPVSMAEMVNYSACYLTVSELTKLLDEVIASRMDQAMIEREKVVVDEALIDRDYRDNAQKRGGSVSYEFALGLEGHSPESFRDYLRRHYGVRMILEKPPSEETLRVFFDLFQDDLGFGDQVRVRDLFIPELSFRDRRTTPPSEESWAEARKRIDAAWAELQAGAAFDGEFIKRHVTDEGRRGKQGDLGWLDRTHARYEGLRDRGFAMEPGEVCEPYKAAHGYHILGVIEKKGAISFEEAMADPKSRRTIRKQYQIRGRKALRLMERERHDIKILIDFDALLPKE